MMQSIRAQISDAVIRRNTTRPVRQISDTRFPLKFRYSSNRARGSWFVVHNQSWRKIGTYPGMNASLAVKAVPGELAHLADNPGADSAALGRFVLVDDLLSWYSTRALNARYLSKNRRGAIASIVRRHLSPKLGQLPWQTLNHDEVDRRLIQPMQQEYSLAYTRQVLDVLRLAYKQAQKLRQIDHNPIAGFSFADFIQAPIKPKDGRLRRQSLPRLVADLEPFGAEYQMLVLLMLMHGTRIGETRAIRWDYIDWGDKTLVLPADITKTGESYRIPLTPYAVAMVKRYRAQQELRGYKGAYFFPNHRGGHISDTRAGTMVRAVSRGDWSAHDLRKLARTCWADLGVDYMVSERLLNHKLSGLDQAYIHTYVEAQKREALEKYHNWLRRTGLDELSANF